MLAAHIPFRVFCILLFLFASCKKKAPLFIAVDRTQTHIDFQNTITNTPTLNILNYLYFYNGAGVAAADFNNDGFIDLYFTANQTEDKLYINLGNLIFKDITEKSGIHNTGNWTTGVTTVDINNDGLLDIYVCKIGNYNGIKGRNLLYVNKGIHNGIPTFKEEALHYGLAIEGFSTQAVFFDYDRDSDLDMFLLNHSVHPNSNYGHGYKRTEPNAFSGDKLFENIANIFTEVSSKAGIFQGKIGYGLGVAVSDINNDGYPDIYVGNDFFENDYLYINQKNKTFKELISADQTKLGHTTHFSMGNTINDINNDGTMDIISLDMLPEALHTYKTSGLEHPYSTYTHYLKNGYAPQYMQNTLHLNSGNGHFSETAFLSGIAATEWSWCPLLADFDNDGYKDLYITNGILGATNDMDFINFIANRNIQQQLHRKKKQFPAAFIEKIPQKKTINYFFKNKGDQTFENMTKIWSSHTPSYSNGATYADLDNDGDLDIVVNNTNEPAFIIQNTSNNEHHYIKIKFKGSNKNNFGIGAKVYAYIDNQCITGENYTTRGYLSAVNPTLHLGLGRAAVIDSLHIIWPEGVFQSIKNVAANQELTVTIADAKCSYSYTTSGMTTSYLSNTSPLFDSKHIDPPSLEFNSNPLIPYASTNLGPPVSVADIDNNGLDDVFIGGGKTQESHLFIQHEDGSFTNRHADIFNHDAIHEDVGSIFFDANNDGYKELLVVSGGNEFKKGKPLNPRWYNNNGGFLIKDTIPFHNIEINASGVDAVDIDNDGDLDLCIISNLIPSQFGKTPQQYIFENDGSGNFKNITSIVAPDFQYIGNVQDMVWVDLNNDHYKDLIVVGHWMPVCIFLNTGKNLTLQENNALSKTHGWWNTVKAADFDNDGDIDIVAGNWGLNTRLKASLTHPITLYRIDVDTNGSIDPLVTYFYQGVETPFASKDELTKQLPFLNKRYLSYTDFATASFKTLFPEATLQNTPKKRVFELSSCYFENMGNAVFKKQQLPFAAQTSTVNAITIDDFDNNGFLDLFLVGNTYEISTQLGRLDASHGHLMLNDKKGFFNPVKNQIFDVSGPARNIRKLRVNDTTHYIISINNDRPVFLKKNQ